MHVLAIALSQAAKAKSIQSIKSSAVSLQPTADGRSRPCCESTQPFLRYHAVLLHTLSTCQSVKLSPCRSRRLSSPRVSTLHTRTKTCHTWALMGEFDSAPQDLSESHPYTIRAASVSGSSSNESPILLVSLATMWSSLQLSSDGQQILSCAFSSPKAYPRLPQVACHAQTLVDLPDLLSRVSWGARRMSGKTHKRSSDERS